MKNFIKILSCLLALVMLLSLCLTACGSGDGEETDTQANTETQTTDTQAETDAPDDDDDDGDDGNGNGNGNGNGSGNGGGSGDGGDTSTPPTDAELFKTYQSNTVAATGNNTMLISDTAVTKTFRGLFEVEQYGEYEYKLFFSNNVDSTGGEPEQSHRAIETAAYKIVSAKIGTVSANTHNAFIGEISNPVTLTFGGSQTKDVSAGETYWSDALTLNVASGECLLYEWTVEYTKLPATCANWTIRVGDLENGAFTADATAALPALIGCKRGNITRIAFLGDSFTMGEGASSYSHKGYVGLIADAWGTDASVWNLGLGYARAEDAANSPSWLYKAKQNDIVVICLGINDLNSGAYNDADRDASEILADITKVVTELQAAGCEVIIASTPPYYYGEADKTEWATLVASLATLAGQKQCKFFDMGVLSDDTTPSAPKAEYAVSTTNGHPNDTGHKAIADAFVAADLVVIMNNYESKSPLFGGIGTGTEINFSDLKGQ